ncbi:MAG: prepilin peptidase [Betaproteobacteria bacterium]|nr:prepilin peptidase [Betaproteobacteria bacterium]
MVRLGQLGFALLLAASCVSDWRSRRIPNVLTVAGLFGALAFHGLAPGGAGLFDPYLPGGLGLKASLLGAGVALVLLLLPYSRGWIGAGDTKLMAAVGGFVGLAALPAVLLGVMLSAGVLALVYALLDRELRSVGARIAGWMRWPLVTPGDVRGHEADASVAPAPRLPMALAIASGVAGFALAAYFNLLG